MHLYDNIAANFGVCAMTVHDVVMMIKTELQEDFPHLDETELRVQIIDQGKVASSNINSNTVVYRIKAPSVN